jgi:ABC-type Zn uptake system ZnuABC Zn-binding protein ZnuA
MPLIPTRPLSRRSLARLAAVTVAGGASLPLSGAPGAAQGGQRLRVVATFSILEDWVRNVGGDAIELATIVPAGGDAHTFDPNPEQVASIADAGLIVEIGVGFETWLDDMVASSGSSATRVVVSDGVELLSFDASHDGSEEKHDDEDGHGDHDPHIWGDVANAVIAVETIRAALAAADPGNAAAYDANAKAYTAELTDLDARITEQIASIPEDARKLVTTHDTFGYYAHAYGLEIIGTALNSLSTEGGDPPASDIANLVETIDDAGVPAIFAENVTNSDLMETIADEAGVELAPPLYSDALGEPGSDGDTYVRMLEYNTATIVSALGG